MRCPGPRMGVPRDVERCLLTLPTSPSSAPPGRALHFPKNIKNTRLTGFPRKHNACKIVSLLTLFIKLSPLLKQ